MFRELVRKRKAIPQDVCIDVLKNETRGVLSVLGDDDYPYGMPMNHLYDEETGKIYFHVGSQRSHRNDAIRKHDKVSYCVYDQGYKDEGDWAYNVKSIIVFGRIAVIEDKDRIIEITSKLTKKFTDDAAYLEKELRDNLKRTLLLEITPEHISGKYVKEA
ncbi:MAG: pyridoxamine 5'-phosphate oxidase family protein [Oscillospiraceae bacterium]|nr:pyridoxamine 5'-phosphate oxidase family protein [Oscillospiraceae bacterium]